MSKKSPNVIFKSKYCLALSSVDNKNNSSSYTNDRLKDVDDMLDYFSNVKKKLVGMFEYYMGHTRGENVNLVLENGNYATKQDLKKLKQDYKKYIEKSNLWKGILSFNKEYIDENISIKTLEQKMAKEIIPQFLKYCGFKDTKNMSYIFSIHSNTKHPHIHFAFIEKKPSYKYSDKTLGYRRKGKIAKDEQSYLKRLVELVIEKEKYYTPLLQKTNQDIDYLKSYFSPFEKNFALKNIDELFIEEKILTLGELVKNYRNRNNQFSKKLKFNSIRNNELGKEIKSLTKDIKEYLLNNDNSMLYSCKKDIDNDLDKLNKYFEKLDNENNIDSNISSNSIVDKKSKYIDNYILNSIVNHALYKYNHISFVVKNKKNLGHITIEDLIQEVAYQNYIKEHRYFNKRKNILDNYFKGSNNSLKFPNKYKMEKAIKNINYEMEKASMEFHNLFNYDKNL